MSKGRASADIGYVGVNTVVFDLDGTLVKGGSWPALFGAMDAADEHEAMLRKYLAGGFESYMDWSKEACGVLSRKGLTRSSFYEVINSAPLTDGAEYLCKALKVRGYKTGIITGGFEAMAQRIKNKFDMDFYAAACCDMQFGSDGSFSGWSLNECDYEGKAERLLSLSKLHDFRPDQCAYIGDGDGDVAAMKKVGLPIAFNPKTEEVRKAAKFVVECNDMKTLLKYFPPITIY